MITIIAAAGKNNELGKDNDLVWHLPDDFKRFKQLTTGHHIIMGRKTFESFPKPLPNRTHIIITRNKSYQPVLSQDVKSEILVVNSMKEALEKSEEDSQPFIIGGGEIYEMGMKHANKIELTRVHENFNADTFFPLIPSEKWKIISDVFHDKDDRHKYAFSYQTFIRK
jgi:dihydrofolate reductase